MKIIAGWIAGKIRWDESMGIAGMKRRDIARVERVSEVERLER